jgi:hypothetical protein
MVQSGRFYPRVKSATNVNEDRSPCEQGGEDIFVALFRVRPAWAGFNPVIFHNLVIKLPVDKVSKV